MAVSPAVVKAAITLATDKRTWIVIGSVICGIILMIVRHVSKDPFIGHIGMFQIGNRAIITGGKDIVPFLCCPQGFEIRFVLFAVPRRPDEGRKGAAGTGTIGNDFFCIAGKDPFIVAQVADGSFHIDQKRRGLACIGAIGSLIRPASGTGSRYDAAPCQGGQYGVRTALPLIVF